LPNFKYIKRDHTKHDIPIRKGSTVNSADFLAVITTARPGRALI